MITQCRSCKTTKLIKILRLGNFSLPLFIFSDEKSDKNKFPLELVLCTECSLVQLSQSVASNELYNNNYGYRSGVNRTMHYELLGVVKNIEKLIELPEDSIVLDIGSNDGTLLKKYTQKSIYKVGFDPVAKFSTEYNQIDEIFINNYFNKQDFKSRFPSQKARVITAISMFYDIEDPNKLISDISDCLDHKGLLIIQQNYLLSMIKTNAFDNIVHEHLEYYSLYSLEKLLERHGLEVFDVIENTLNGGSFRTYIGFIDARWKKTARVKSFRNKERNKQLRDLKTYMAFSRRIAKLRNKTRKFIQHEINKNKRFYVYGASTRGNTILQYYGLDKNFISAAVERNPEKWGKLISPSGIPIISEAQARKEKPDYMLVLPWFFKEEFLQREKNYMKQGGKLVFPLPDLEVVST